MRVRLASCLVQGPSQHHYPPNHCLPGARGPSTTQEAQMVSRETSPPILLPPWRLPRPPNLRRLLLFLRCCPSPIVGGPARATPLQKVPSVPQGPSIQVVLRWPSSKVYSGLRQERHKGTEAVLCPPTSGNTGTPAPRPTSGSQLGVSWPGGKASILTREGRFGISGHSSAQWPSSFLKGLPG